MIGFGYYTATIHRDVFTSQNLPDSGSHCGASGVHHLQMRHKDTVCWRCKPECLKVSHRSALSTGVLTKLLAYEAMYIRL